MKLSELAGEKFSTDPEITGITADSRFVEKGFLYAAIKGENADGAKFIPQAEQNGAAAVLGALGVSASVPTISDPEPRRRLSQLAAKFYEKQPGFVAGITGTNGKTSTALFAAQLWSLLGEASGSIGTLGAAGKNFHTPLQHTTPEPVTLHRVLAEMAGAKISHVAMEVSSHAISQYRADSVKFSCAAFTNITQDHLDYHGSFDAYFDAKARLFSELAPQGATAVVNADGEGCNEIIKLTKARGLKVMTTGLDGRDIRLVRFNPQPTGMNAVVEARGKTYDTFVPLVGAFQLENVLLAAGIVIASGAEAKNVLPHIANLAGAPGRMELVGEVSDAGVYVDYAHTPDAIATALRAIRPHASKKVVAIIGAGGDRDQTKRALMGKSASELADKVIVTDDNPRNEDPAKIRQDVLAGCDSAVEIGDRREAIGTGVSMLREGDVLLVMGKGHETGQRIGDKTFPFSDVEEVRAAIDRRQKEIGR
ncbi:MAG: UDP-N-acetylmuramoyl-L-alanyl-D-glutamate--2,6-diaminopimelate ligase [Marinicaulis sp.]|nr:UDP-N-acetylmuramoyl-L-alanyl-D-glutamate--2,6-diaminopimelate ligase [Marinicaulis sp.]